MSMTTDRSALEEAIRELTNIWSKGSMVLPSGFDCTMSPAFCKRIQLVCDAASAHAETMPKPMWRLTIWFPNTPGFQSREWPTQSQALADASGHLARGALKVEIDAP